MSVTTELQTAPLAEQQTAIARQGNDASESPEWQRVLREAEKLAAAPLTPTHLKVLPKDLGHIADPEQRRRIAWQQTVANCVLVANQARRWQADVFAVASETYVVGNKLGYQGKLIAAIVNTRVKLEQQLRPLYSTGKGDLFAAVIYGKKEGAIPEQAYSFLERYADDEDRKALRELGKLGVLAVRVSVGQAKTANKMWLADPEQKLWYTGATKWARRFAPEVMLGILSSDDLEYMQEREAGQPQLAESRIDQVIPATLDASGITSVLPPLEQPEDEPTPSDPDATESEPPDETTITTIDRTENIDRVLGEVVDIVKTATELEVANEEANLRNFADANPWFGGEPLEKGIALCRARAVELQKQQSKAGRGRR